MPSSLAAQRDASSQKNSQRSTIRIASLLPGLTDLVRDLNLSQYLIATSHECDHPPTTQSVTKPKLATSRLTPLEINSGWNALAIHPLCNALSTRICSFYTVDIDALRILCPSILLTHLTPTRDLQPSHEEVLAALDSLIPGVKVINANPTTLRQIYQLYREIAAHVHISAINTIANARTRLLKLSMLPVAKRPRIAVVQWTQPLYLAGEWVAELVSLCARTDGVTSPGSPSLAVHPSALRNVDIVVFAICALDMQACSNVIRSFWALNHQVFSNWSGRFICTDSTKLFSRVALSVVVTTAEVIAEIVMKDGRYGHKGSLWNDWHVS